jgi:RNA polymerase sigma-70 factor, ECF subfamily
MAFVIQTIDWNGIIAAHGGLVWWTADCILRDRSDVEDCFQETFIAAVKLSRRKRIDNWPAALRHLAAARAIDRLRSRIRQRRFVSSAKLAAVAYAGPSPPQQLESTELAEQLRFALAQLPRRYAKIFSLHDLMGLSHEEIATAMNIRLANVRVLLHRSRQRLRQLLKTGD